MTCTVLFVDDEPYVLAGLRRALRNEPYKIACASSANQALAILQTLSVNVVVVDQDMPGMTGTTLLAKVRHEFPDTARFILTGKATMNVAIEAINAGAVSRFFTKPCNHAELATNFRQVIQERALAPENLSFAKLFLSS